MSLTWSRKANVSELAYARLTCPKANVSASAPGRWPGSSRRDISRARRSCDGANRPHDGVGRIVLNEMPCAGHNDLRAANRPVRELAAQCDPLRQQAIRASRIRERKRVPAREHDQRHAVEMAGAAGDLRAC